MKGLPRKHFAAHVIQRRSPVFLVVRIGIGIKCTPSDFDGPRGFHVVVLIVRPGMQLHSG